MPLVRSGEPVTEIKNTKINFGATFRLFMKDNTTENYPLYGYITDGRGRRPLTFGGRLTLPRQWYELHHHVPSKPAMVPPLLQQSVVKCTLHLGSPPKPHPLSRTPTPSKIEILVIVFSRFLTVRLSLSSCMMRVLSLYESSWRLSNSAMASSNACTQ